MDEPSRTNNVTEQFEEEPVVNRVVGLADVNKEHVAFDFVSTVGVEFVCKLSHVVVDNSARDKPFLLREKPFLGGRDKDNFDGRGDDSIVTVGNTNRPSEVRRGRIFFFRQEEEKGFVEVLGDTCVAFP